MTDATSNTPMIRSRKPARTEYFVYFGVIFLATLPLATLTWALAMLKSGRIPTKGPMARAWSQAGIITPMIFSA